MSLRPPLWGNFVYYADYDLLSFALLMKGQLFAPAMYHGTQCLEKYLKALALSTIDPQGTTETPHTQRWLKSHKLLDLADRCGNKHPYYLQADTPSHLRRFEEYDQATRYPWVIQNHANGFSDTDIPILEKLVFHLRNDLPIVRDDYPLGMLVRGHHYDNPQAEPRDSLNNTQKFSVACLKELFGNVDGLVRWKTAEVM